MRLGVVILVSNVRRQLDDFAYREEPAQICKEFAWNVDRYRAHAIGVLECDPLSLGEIV